MYSVPFVFVETSGQRCQESHCQDSSENTQSRRQGRQITLSHHRGTHHQQPQCQTNYHSVLKEPWFKVALDGHRGDRFVPTIPMANQL